jgi:hypothetical protein
MSLGEASPWMYYELDNLRWRYYELVNLRWMYYELDNLRMVSKDLTSKTVWKGEADQFHVKVEVSLV